MAQETNPLLRWLAPIAWLRKLQDVSVTNKSPIATVTAGLLGNINTASNNNNNNNNSSSKKRFIQKSLRSLPTEVALEVFAHLDSATLYQLTLVSREYRHLLAHHEASRCWNALVFEPHIPLDDVRINSIMRFLTKFQLHMYIRSAQFDGTTIDVTRLEKILRHLPYITDLSVAHCPNLDCYQVLHLLKSSAKNTSFDDNNSIISTSSSHTGLAPFLQHLEQLSMQGLFPSERGQKSYAHEMYAYGMIKKLLLRQPCQDLSESHYALYQFWLLLRSRMLLIAGDSDFRPPWLPDELVQFIQVIEGQQHVPHGESTDNNNNNNELQRQPIADVEPCHLCHKNVASSGSAACKICGVATPKSCAQCMCLQCGNILCLTCYRQFCGGNSSNAARNESSSQALLPLSATAAAALVAVATTTSGQRPHCGMPWQIVRCRQCHLSRRVCGSTACQKPFMTSERRMVDKWFCTSCKEKRRNDRWKAKARLLRRSARQTDDYIQWND